MYLHYQLECLLTNLLTKIYDQCFSRIYVFSQSVEVDSAWVPVRNYIKDKLNVNEDKEDFFFEEYSDEKLHEIINNQKKVVQWLKNNSYKQMYQICIVFDDMLDQTAVMKHNNTLNSLFVRGRHFFI